jgi:hypothetical protein
MNQDNYNFIKKYDDLWLKFTTFAIPRNRPQKQSRYNKKNKKASEHSMFRIIFIAIYSESL